MINIRNAHQGSARIGYVSPRAELIRLAHPTHLLVSASVEADIEDWEIGDEL